MVNTTRPDRDRPSVKRGVILADLRQRIVTGSAPPGSRLPNRAELEEQFGASTATVQQAFNTLIEDGFIDVRGVRGSYVSARPPHLCNYGLVFEGGFESSQFLIALRDMAVQVSRQTDRRISIYHHVNAQGGTPDERRLLADIRAQRLAGLVFVFSPYSLAGRPVLTEPGVERVALMGRAAFGISAVWVDEAGFVERALDMAAQRGRRRVAVLRNLGEIPSDSHWHRWPEMVASRGLETRPYWQLVLPAVHADSLRQAVHLLMNPRQEERPDVLIVSDDNMVEAVTAGLLAAGCLVPQQLEVIAHANFPLPTRSHVPAIRLGFDVRQLLHAAFDTIDRRRRGQDVEAVTIVPVVNGEGLA